MSDPISQKHSLAMGAGHPGYGTYHKASGGAVHMAHKQHHVPKAGHHNMDGHIGHGAHGHTHKSHGHTEGVVHQKTGGVGEGGASGGPHQGTHSGPSSNQFGDKMPSGGGSSLGRW